MNQAQWNARVASRPDVWQYFKMDEASGLPQDSSPDYSQAAHMTGGSGAAYGVAGPFTDAEAVTVAAMFTSPVYSPLPAPDANFGNPKTMEGYVYLHNAPSALGVLLGSNIAVLMRTDRHLQLIAQGVALGPVSTNPFPLDEWHFVMLTTDGGGGMTLYIDDDVEATWTAGWPIPNGSFLVCGQSGPASTFTFSNLAFYNGGQLLPDLGGRASGPAIYRSGIVY